MRVLVLGGTGTIGRAVVAALRGRGHGMLALARSEASASTLRAAGAEPLPGDIRTPEAWVDRAVARTDGVIHVACGFDDDMAAVEEGLLRDLLPAMAATGRGPTLIYTGGCWLYGATGDRIAVEDSPFEPPPEWAWMVAHHARVHAAAGIRAITIHPAMVWDDDGGVLRGMRADARAGRPLTVVGGDGVRWPLVHADDLADLYCRALEAAPPGASYNGAAIEGMAVGDLARAIARRAGRPIMAPVVRPVADAIAAQGGWARGYALDQQMSGAKARRDLGWAPVRLDPADVAR